MKNRFMLINILALLLILVPSSIVAAATVERINILVGFDAPPGLEEQQLIRGLGGDIKYTYKIIPAIAASVPQPAVQGLIHNPHVIAVEPEVFAKASDLELDNAWGVNHIGAGLVHDAGITGENVNIAILDTGLDWTHPDLYQRMAGGYNFIADNYNPFDDNGHGTHVAGIIAALDNGAGVVGAAPKAKLWILKVLDSTGTGSYFDIIAALDWATGNNIWGVVCQITNNSYGSPDYPGSMVEMAFQLAYSTWGQLHIAAAGNSGVASGRGDNVEYPARFSSVLAVAATDQSDTRGYFSSTGSDVELAAPGVSIMSTVPGEGYEAWSGTSMASPHVAGTAVLVWASGITDTNHNGFLNDEVRLRLQDTAKDIGVVGRDNYYGFGLVDAAAACGLAPGPPPPPPKPSNEMAVSSMSIVFKTKKLQRITYVNAITNVTIKDAYGNVVEGAAVSGHWEDATNDSDYSLTGSNGVVALSSDKVKSPPSGTIFTFVVDSVTKDGWTWTNLPGEKRVSGTW